MTFREANEKLWEKAKGLGKCYINLRYELTQTDVIPGGSKRARCSIYNDGCGSYYSSETWEGAFGELERFLAARDGEELPVDNTQAPLEDITCPAQTDS